MSSSVRFKRLQDSVKVIRSSLTLHVSPSGSDGNSGLRVNEPFETIQKAFTYLKDYLILDTATVTISLSAGEHRITEEISVTHPQGNRIFLRGANGVSSTINSVTGYEDTTDYSGRVGTLNYRELLHPLEGDGSSGPISDERFNMAVEYTATSGLTNDISVVGKPIVITPHDSNGEIQFYYNNSSLGNSGSGITASSTAVQRFTENHSTMDRMFAFGSHVVKTTLLDVGINPILENRVRNKNVYEGVQNQTTGRNHSDGVPSFLRGEGNTTVPTRLIHTKIFIPSDKNAIRITNSALTVEDVAFETYDPLVESANKSTSSAVVVEEGSSLILRQGFSAKNFNVGIEVKNRSLLRQSSTNTNLFHAVSYCGTGVLVSDNSQADLHGFVCTGCWNDGFVVNNQSNGEFAACVSSANGRHGFIATRNSNMIMNRCLSAYNFQNISGTFSANEEAGVGFGCKLNSNMECASSLSFRNGYGFLADKNSSMNINSCDTRDNLNRSISVSESSDAIVGPFFHSFNDAHGQYVSDSSFCRNIDNHFEGSGLDTASGASGSAFTVVMNSSSNLLNVELKSYAKNGIESIYGSNTVGFNLTISGASGMVGDAINCTYNSLARLSGSTLAGRSTNRVALLNGFIELNGVEN